MTLLVIEHEGDRIVNWRHEVDEAYTPAPNEFVTDADVNPSELVRYSVDTSTTPPTLAETETDDPREPLERLLDNDPVTRATASDSTKTAFRDARDAGDLQTQLDVLFTILTGEQP